MRFVAALALIAIPVALAAQDTTRVEQGVRVGIAYRPGVRPGIVVLRGTVGVEDLLAIVQRDLDYSDRYEIIALPGGDSLRSEDDGDADVRTVASAEQAGRPINYALYAALGAEFIVQFMGRDTTARAVVHRVPARQVLATLPLALPDPDDRRFRMAAHHVSDEIVRVTMGAPGIAATELLLVRNQEILRIGTDGYGRTSVTSGTASVLSPTWSPDGQRVAYVAFEDDRWKLYERDLANGSPRIVFGTGNYSNLTPIFSPDGWSMAFGRSWSEGTHLFKVNLRDRCCLERLTVTRFSDNLSPTFSPDGSRIAFVSTRPGAPQIYVMGSDGTGQELFAEFDFGVTGSSYAPEWSPDGQQLVFHRDISGTPQVFVLDVRTRDVKQVTSTGRNEDATWAPDSRHIAFVSNRTGARQIWIMDLETGRVRQLTRGRGRLPAWSPRLAVPTVKTP